MKKEIKIIILTYLAFGIYCLLDEFFFKDLRNVINQIVNIGGVSHILTYLISGIPIFLGLILIHGFKKSVNGFGFTGSFSKGIFVPLLFTLPMFVGFAIVIDNKSVKAFINDSKIASLEVDKLSNNYDGKIGVFMGDDSGGDFSNIRIAN